LFGLGFVQAEEVILSLGSANATRGSEATRGLFLPKTKAKICGFAADFVVS
jgi:hypothetical protein